MAWFATAAGSAVTNSRFEHVHSSNVVRAPSRKSPSRLYLPTFARFPRFQASDSHLVATLLPKTSHFLPRVPSRNLDAFFSFRCFRVACELLFAQASCFVQYSDGVPATEFEDEDEEMVVTLVRARPAFQFNEVQHCCGSTSSSGVVAVRCGSTAATASGRQCRVSGDLCEWFSTKKRRATWMSSTNRTGAFFISMRHRWYF